MKMDSLDSLTYGGVRGRENLFNFPSYSIVYSSPCPPIIAYKTRKEKEEEHEISQAGDLLL